MLLNFFVNGFLRYKRTSNGLMASCLYKDGELSKYQRVRRMGNQLYHLSLIKMSAQRNIGVQIEHCERRRLAFKNVREFYEHSKRSWFLNSFFHFATLFKEANTCENAVRSWVEYGGGIGGLLYSRNFSVRRVNSLSKTFVVQESAIKRQFNYKDSRLLY